MNKLAICITTYNRGYLLRNTIDSIACFTHPDNNITVIDDGSNDNTEKICKTHDISYIYTHNPGYTGAPKAKNIGIKHINAEWIIFTEAENIFLNDIVKRAHELIKSDEYSFYSTGYCVGIRKGFKYSDKLAIFPRFIDNYPNKIYTLMDYRMGGCDTYTHPEEGDDESLIVTIGNVAPYLLLIKKEHLLAIGGWDEQCPGVWGGDDRDLINRLNKSGIKHKIDIDLRIAHQWHGRPEGYYEGMENLNSEYFKNSTEIIANIGKEWGIIKKKE